MTKKTRIVRFAVLCLVLVHLLAMTCFAADYTGFDGVQVWTEGAMTPLTTENTGNALKITSTNDPADWWKVKLEMPRTVEAGKVYEAKFVFTSDATGTIKYHVGDASFLTANEYNVQAGENTFAIRFVAGNDDYSCLELGGLGKFVLTFTEISVKEEVQEEEPGEHTVLYRIVDQPVHTGLVDNIFAVLILYHRPAHASVSEDADLVAIDTVGPVCHFTGLSACRGCSLPRIGLASCHGTQTAHNQSGASGCLEEFSSIYILFHSIVFCHFELVEKSLNHLMYFVSFYMNCSERSCRTQVLAGAASYTSLFVYCRNHQ